MITSPNGFARCMIPDCHARVRDYGHGELCFEHDTMFHEWLQRTGYELFIAVARQARLDKKYPLLRE